MKTKRFHFFRPLAMAMTCILTWNSCQKSEVKIPETTDVAESYCYIELDGVKHLFTDNINNRNKNTMADFNFTNLYVLSDELYIYGDFMRLGQRQTYEDVSIDVRIPFGLGGHIATEAYFSSIAIKQNNNYESFESKYDRLKPYNSNSVDSIIFIDKIDSTTHAVRIRYEGNFTDLQNSNRTHHIKIVSEVKGVAF